MDTGLLVVLEGIDGAGTTTQSQRLEEGLREAGYECHVTREPSTGPIGRLLREVLEGGHKPIDATTMGLLFAADRADHVQREIVPHMREGEIVITDRYVHSSLAYQGADEDRAWIETLNARALRPDLVLFLRVDPEVAANRRAAADRNEEIYDKLDTQKRVAAGYDAVMQARRDTEEIVVVDGHRTLDEISKELVTTTLRVCEASKRHLKRS
jgi:dTMP kinase